MADNKLQTIVQRMIDAGEPEENIASVIRSSKPQSQTDSDALAVSGGLSGLQRIAEGVASNPNLPKTTATIGRVLGGLSPVVGGAVKAGPAGAAIGMAGAAHGAWAGGKTGWFTGKLAQRLATPVASLMERLQPLGGAAGVGDLAQMAEPNRRDIGFLGIGKSVDVPGAEPPLINALVAKLLGR